MIQVDDLQVSFKQFCALDLPGTFMVPDRSIVAVLGSNGAGKTTFINALLGEVPYTGTVKGVNHKDLGVLFQNNAINPLLRVDEFCATVRVKVDSPLKDLFKISPLLKKRVESLSGGELQRLMLFLVLSQDKGTYFFDEITTGLDFQTRESLIEKVREATSKSTVFITTHYFEEVEDWATHCLFLHKGLPVFVGKVSEFLSRHEHFSLLKLPEISTLPESLKNRAEQFPWASKERYIQVSTSDEQSELIASLTQLGQNFEVQPRSLRTSYVLALKQFLANNVETGSSQVHPEIDENLL